MREGKSRKKGSQLFGLFSAELLTWTSIELTGFVVTVACMREYGRVLICFFFLQSQTSVFFSLGEKDLLSFDVRATMLTVGHSERVMFEEA